MDRRSWLWRRKSSEKSPGETESSGSISSYSERFSDDQAFGTHSTQSLEVTLKDALNDEDENESIKSLRDKLSAALLNISAKDDLVKQHAKVAEEAVSGWEKAEDEVLSLKQKLEAANQKNFVLEDRLGHLDGALKECVRQLRQAREEQEQQITEAVAKKTREWESLKSELELQLQTAKTEASLSIASELENENLALKLELFSRSKELEVAVIERDLSTKAAETASKQHLESTKKVTKLEAECRRLKAMARKVSQVNPQKSFSASSIYMESYADSQSDSGERLSGTESSQLDLWASELQLKNEKGLWRNLMVPSVELNLMDDFLEMERLAAFPSKESNGSSRVSDQSNYGESHLKSELEVLIHRTAELEEKLEKIEKEKVELEVVLTECQKQLMEADLKLEELQRKFVLAEDEVKATESKREIAESQLKVAEMEVGNLVSQVGLLEEDVWKEQLKVGSLEEEVRKERDLASENAAQCRKLENELASMKQEDEIRREAELKHMESNGANMKIKQEKELALATGKLAECQKTIASLSHQLTSLATLEDFLLDSENPKEFTGIEDEQLYGNGVDSKDSDLPKSDYEALPLKNGNERKPVLAVDRAAIASEKNKNGFGKFLPRNSKTGNSHKKISKLI